ncbi:hypothetical protein PFDG_03997 [Plasmodium falciparum Dd2]|uniref:Uncharacterized protein n=1 Tax=Plasmodium falciparum (isolate Dd2) TaxID=57267 RepID=A0A0L7M4X8_PLAF4|nr:hypothetical protein PFDG_03997 [Plasmodium falciparum Dd2]
MNIIKIMTMKKILKIVIKLIHVFTINMIHIIIIINMIYILIEQEYEQEHSGKIFLGLSSSKYILFNNFLILFIFLDIYMIRA